MKIGLFIISLLIFQTLQAQDDSPESQIKQMLSSVQIIKDILNVTDTSINAHWEANYKGIIDSICSSHKTIRDFGWDEDNYYGNKIISLGNDINYYEHSVSNLKITYVMYHYDILKINFEYEFSRYYDENDDSKYPTPERSLLDSIKLAKNIPFAITYDTYNEKGIEKERVSGYFFSFYYNQGKEKLLKNEKVKLDIDFEQEDEDFKEIVSSINDAAVKLTYGFACSVSGSAPRGLFVFAGITHYKKIYLAEQLLYSPNPVTRLMAADAIEKLQYNPSIKIKNRVKEIRNDNTLINACWGCSSENISMKDAYKKADITNKDIYDAIFFVRNSK